MDLSKQTVSLCEINHYSHIMRILLYICLFLSLCESVCAQKSIPDFALAGALKRHDVVFTSTDVYVQKVFSEKDFRVENNHRTIVFELQNDIIISSGVLLYTQKEYHIKGNGYTISETSFTKPVISATYQAKSWSVNRNNLVEMKLKEPVDLSMFNHDDRLLIKYETWYRRFRANIVSINDSLIMLQCDDKILNNPQKHIRWTPSPYFWIEKVEGNGTNMSAMVKVGKGVKLFVHDTNFTRISNCCIDNKGVLKVENCKFSNANKDCIKSSGEAFIRNSHFEEITAFPISSLANSYLEVVGCSFNRIGLRGDNHSCISARGDSYIANNVFSDFNYSAIKIGVVNATNVKQLPSVIVEYNKLSWSDSWKKEIVKYGLNDGGAIYATTNNKRTIIRYNTIKDFGGHGANKAIFCDDGSYNITIYGNVITGTANSYDISARDCSRSRIRKTPKEYSQNTGNYIAYNICDGKLEIAGSSIVADNKCVFENNIIVGKHDRDKNIVKNVKNPRSAILYDHKGHIDVNGKVSLSTRKSLVRGNKAPVF